MASIKAEARSFHIPSPEPSDIKDTNKFTAASAEASANGFNVLEYLIFVAKCISSSPVRNEINNKSSSIPNERQVANTLKYNSNVPLPSEKIKPEQVINAL